MFNRIFNAIMEITYFIRDSIRERRAQRERNALRKIQDTRNATMGREAGWRKQDSMRNAKTLGQNIQGKSK